MSRKRLLFIRLGLLGSMILFWGSVSTGQDLQQAQEAQIKELWDQMLKYAQTGPWEKVQQTGNELLSLNPDSSLLELLGQSAKYAETYRSLMGLPQEAPVPREAAVQMIIKLSENHWYWDDFMHYARIGRFDLAEQFGQALIKSEPDPELMLELAESERYQYSYRSLSLMQANTPLKEIATEIFKLVEEGRFRRRSDIDRIAVEVNRLSSPTTRGRTMATTRLKDSGEWAVPVMVEVLRDANRQSEFAALRRALPQLGQAAVNPLVVALQDSKDLNVKLVAAEALGKIGYRSALPYMLEILESDQSAELKAAALTALNLIDRDNKLGQQTAAQAFVQLGDDYYNHQPILEAPAHQDFANIWFWNDDNGLYREAVDREAFDELMTMRCCEAALLSNRNLATAVSLWLSAFSRLEADGHAQPAYFGENHADASTFRLTAGAAYLQQVLVWALENRNRPVALMAITSMRRNSGQQALLYNLGTDQPLLEALNFPDREIRFSAALAVGGALPRADFDRSELVIPILVEALQQRGEQYALIIDSNQDRLNRLTGQLRETGKFAEIVSGEHFGSTMEAARHLPSFDLVLVAADVEQPGLAETLASMQQDYRLAFCPTMIIVDGTTLARAKKLQEQYSFTGVAYEEQKANYLLLEADEILTRNQSREFSSLLADTYAQNAAVILLNLALSNNQVLDLKAAEPALLEAAIHENRLQIQEAATRTLAKMDSTAAQRTIARLALDEQRDLYMRGMALQNLGISAKAFGSLLSVDDINALYRIVSSLEIDSNLRNLAAEAYGSLNLPSARISQLIIDQIRKGNGKIRN